MTTTCVWDQVLRSDIHSPRNVSAFSDYCKHFLPLDWAQKKHSALKYLALGT
jgi:hypothetical protein